MFNWILSFFSSEAHVRYMVQQMQSVASSVERVKAKLTYERETLEDYYSITKDSIDSRGKLAERVRKTVEAFAPDAKN